MLNQYIGTQLYWHEEFTWQPDIFYQQKTSQLSIPKNKSPKRWLLGKEVIFREKSPKNC
jgi:hypothetical protein